MRLTSFYGILLPKPPEIVSIIFSITTVVLLSMTESNRWSQLPAGGVSLNTLPTLRAMVYIHDYMDYAVMSAVYLVLLLLLKYNYTTAKNIHGRFRKFYL